MGASFPFKFPSRVLAEQQVSRNLFPLHLTLVSHILYFSYRKSGSGVNQRAQFVYSTLFLNPSSHSQDGSAGWYQPCVFRVVMPTRRWKSRYLPCSVIGLSYINEGVNDLRIATVIVTADVFVSLTRASRSFSLYLASPWFTPSLSPILSLIARCFRCFSIFSSADLSIPRNTSLRKGKTPLQLFSNKSFFLSSSLSLTTRYFPPDSLLSPLSLAMEKCGKIIALVVILIPHTLFRHTSPSV